MKNFKSDTLKVSVQCFDKQLAQEILATVNTNNYRKIKPGNVRTLKEDMKNGQWEFVGDCIRFDKNGILLDGQHRLQAIIDSDTVQTFVVVQGLDPNCGEKIDIGFKRSLEDYLRFTEEAFEKGTTAIVKRVYNFRTKRKSQGQSIGNSPFTRTQIINTYREDAENYNKAAEVGEKFNKLSNKVLNKTDVGAIYYYLVFDEGNDEEEVLNFFEEIVSSSSKDVNSTYWTTRGKLTELKINRKIGTLVTDEYIKCWNAKVRGWTNKRPSGGWFENLKRA